ncbi:MAG: PhzF family phenazine biosynthesis protein [Solirubrobacteraceae bacterium]
MTLELHLCDVFADRPLTGSSLTAVVHDEPLAPAVMQEITRELRQFETIFLHATDDAELYETRVFDLHRELDFAGHPVLGAAAVLHHLYRDADGEARWRLRIRQRVIPVRTTRGPHAGSFVAQMNQGAPAFSTVADPGQRSRAIAAFSLADTQLLRHAPVEVVSTGLRYMIVPITSGLADARIAPALLAGLLDELDAEFAYIVDINRRAGRHWENDGSAEDIATGSAAGALGAYLVRHGLAQADEPIILSQGEFVGRPSHLHVKVSATPTGIMQVELAGPVRLVAHGTFTSGFGNVAPTAG